MATSGTLQTAQRVRISTAISVLDGEFASAGGRIRHWRHGDEESWLGASTHDAGRSAGITHWITLADGEPESQRLQSPEDGGQGSADWDVGLPRWAATRIYVGSCPMMSELNGSFTCEVRSTLSNLGEAPLLTWE